MKISIITVTYNSAKTLARTIRSVCQQDYPDIEHIIVDGESADYTVNIIKDYAASHPQMRYVTEKDLGIYDAINKGIEMATGDIIGLVNSDDELVNPHIISDIVAQMTQTGADILYGDLVYCKYDDLTHNPPRIIRYWKSKAFQPKDIALGWMPPHPTLYCRKQVFDKTGTYRTDFRIAADYEFILRSFTRPEFKITYLPEVITRMQIGGISNRNIRTMCIKTLEDMRAMRMHKLNVPLTILYKNLRKTKQFFHHQS